ncbi:Uncharacterized protein SCF082_LOCUS27162 [Durusdinium trenchii]|uniref:Peptidase A2 domain-containing protein n=1 Tax=Durusdinium trenchii TaxID=1381693 RepID=A0ABP0MCJ2_9DINO
MVYEEPAARTRFTPGDRMDVRKSPDQSKRLVVSNILGPSAGRRLPSSSLPLRLNATADGGPHGVLNAQVEDEAAVEWRRAKLFANFDAKAKAAWSLEFEADALAAQSECRFLQAEIHRLLAQRAAERRLNSMAMEAQLCQLRDLRGGLSLAFQRRFGGWCLGGFDDFWALANVFNVGEFSDAALVGSGYDLVDVRVLTKEGAPVEATFMLDSGLSTNLVSPSFLEKLGLEAEAEPMEGTALGGNMMKLRSTYLPGLEILGDDGNETRFAGLWQGDGWRAWCTLDWEAWKGAAAKSKTIQGKVQYEVLPSQAMSDAQLEMVGWRGQETVEGEMKAGRFLGRGVSVEPKGVLATTESYEFEEEGDSLVEMRSGMRLQRRGYRPSLPLPGPLHATSVPFTQEQLAQREGIQLDGMLGQLPLYQDFAVEVDPEAKRLTLRMPKEASAAAKEAGMRRLPGMDLPSRLMGVNVFHAALTEGAPGDAVPALVDSGSANSVVNWAAAEVLFGLRQGDRIIRQAPRIRAIGVGGGFIDMPLLRFSLGLVGEGDMLVPHPVRVAIGDAQVFGEIFGREERGGWFGMGPKPLKPAALIGQEHGSTELGSFRHMGEGDCVDPEGRRLAGLQKLGCTTDDAAWECLSLPPG